MEFFGKLYSEALGWPLELGTPVGDCDKVFVCGLYDVPTYEHTFKCIQRAKQKHIHFGGSDVTYLLDPKGLPEATFSADTPALAEELHQKGIDCKFVLYGPTKFHAEVVPFPAKPRVGIYLGTNPVKYGADIIMVLQEAMPDVEFVGYSFGSVPDEEMVPLIQSCNATLRLTDHDGGMATVREFLEAGRFALATSDLDYVIRIRRWDILDIISKLRAVLKETEPNWEAANFYHEANSFETFRSELLANL